MQEEERYGQTGKMEKNRTYSRYSIFCSVGKGHAGNPDKRPEAGGIGAIRLKDMEGPNRTSAPKGMGFPSDVPAYPVSAREKIADSLCNGNVIHIEGGNYTRTSAGPLPLPAERSGWNALRIWNHPQWDLSLSRLRFV
jgi:hypothetical protein